MTHAGVPSTRRVEELTLNSSAPPGQLLYDGWLLRLAPGKAKRARSVNAVYASTLPLEEKIACCEAMYRVRSLPPLFRITPFSEPATLDAALEARGYVKFDDTAVELAPDFALAGERPDASAITVRELVQAVGAMRGSPDTHRAAHFARLDGMPLQMAAAGVHEGGKVVAAGLAILEADSAGLFDIVTDAAHRRRGFARRIVAALLRTARELGARHAYLQVSTDNIAARSMYRDFGFAERYRYWYRARPEDIP